MDPSSIEEKAANHSDECVNSFDKDDHPIHDEIFDILFPSSPTEGNEEEYTSNNYSEEPLTNTEIEPVLTSNDDLVFDYSDASLSDEESNKKIFSQDSQNNGNVIKSQYDNLQNIVTKENSNREGKEIIFNNTMCEEEIESKSTHLKNESKNSDNRNVVINNKYERKLSDKTKKSVNIKKQFLKKDDFIEDISEEDEKHNKELNLKNEDTLEDISDNENEEFYKKEVYLEEITDDEATQSREWATGGKIKKDPSKWKLAASSSSSILKEDGWGWHIMIFFTST